MPTLKLAPDVHALLSNQLDSFEKLELLSALRAAGRPLSPAELASACRLTSHAVRDVLGSLSELSIIERAEDGELFYVAANTRIPAFETLMSVYEDDRSIVLSALSALSLDRIRDMAARTFADVLARKRDDDS